MRVSIDRAGRIVVPKPLREQLGLSPDTPLEIEVIDGHLELSSSQPAPVIADGPHGPTVAATGIPISDRDLRRMLESAREHQ